MAVSECAGCGRPLVSHRAKRRPGQKHYYSHGRCRTCYRRHIGESPHVNSRGTARRGWPSRDGHIDAITVDLAVAGRATGQLEPLEIREAVRRLTREQRSIREIAQTLGVADRTVSRHRAALRVQTTTQAAA